MMPSTPSIPAHDSPEAETLPAATFVIERRKGPHLFGLFVCSIFIGVWIFELCIGIGAEFILMPGFSAFILLFVSPAGLLMVYLMLYPEPVVAVRGSSLHITNATLAWQKAVLPICDIVSVDTDWIPDTSHARIVFYVRPERFEVEDHFGPWTKRGNNALYLDVLNTNYAPDEAVSNLRRIMFPA